jgi:hypothetical protein
MFITYGLGPVDCVEIKVVGGVKYVSTSGWKCKVCNQQINVCMNCNRLFNEG